MKSLILKDLYNISHNMKSLGFILVFLAVTLIPTSDVMGYLYAAAMICSVMIVTTFHFDEACGWNSFALVMPISRKEMAAAKYLTLLLFTGFGALIGLVLGSVGGMLMGKMIPLGELVLFALFALVLGFTIGGVNIPLLIKFGAEQGRLLLLVSCLVVIGIGAGIYFLLQALGLASTEQDLQTLLYLSPLGAAALNYVMFLLSCRFLEAKEF